MKSFKFKIEIFPYSDLTLVGDLLYFDGSLLSVFSDDNKIPYIYKWVDCNNNSNRWLVFKTDRFNLISYLTKDITQFELIKNATEEIYLTIDIDNENNKSNCFAISFKEIPTEYLPKYDLIYDESDSNDINTIKNYFTLNDKEQIISDYDVQEIDATQISSKLKTEIIMLHIKKGKGVARGKARTSTLGAILTGFDDLYKSAVESLHPELFLKPKNQQTQDEKAAIYRLTETEVIIQKAASYTLFIRPVKIEEELFYTQETDKILGDVFNLIQNSQELDDLDSIKDQYKPKLFQSYKLFLNEVKKNSIDVDLLYANAEKKTLQKANFSLKNSFEVIKKIEKLETSFVEKVELIGVFKALDLIELTFKFEDNEEVLYKGAFKKEMYDDIKSSNLMKTYKIILERKIIQKAFKSDDDIKDTLISFNEYKT